jgi:hypothetical protein
VLRPTIEIPLIDPMVFTWKNTLIVVTLSEEEEHKDHGLSIFEIQDSKMSRGVRHPYGTVYGTATRLRIFFF